MVDATSKLTIKNALNSSLASCFDKLAILSETHALINNSISVGREPRGTDVNKKKMKYYEEISLADLEVEVYPTY